MEEKRSLGGKMHPSGMSQQRWNSPFKTQEERKLVIEYFKRMQKEQEIDYETFQKLGKALI